MQQICKHRRATLPRNSDLSPSATAGSSTEAPVIDASQDLFDPITLLLEAKLEQERAEALEQKEKPTAWLDKGPEQHPPMQTSVRTDRFFQGAGSSPWRPSWIAPSDWQWRWLRECRIAGSSSPPGLSSWTISICRAPHMEEGTGGHRRQSTAFKTM